MQDPYPLQTATGASVNFQSLIIPDAPALANRIRISKNSAPGPNGIPAIAHKLIPEEASEVFADTLIELSHTNTAIDLVQYNKSLVWFAPKGHHDEDAKMVVRTPPKLRIIFGANSDSKHIAGSVAHIFVEPMLAVTPFVQRGFCRLRQLALNAVDLDCLLYTSPSPRDGLLSRMPSSA